jgi:hypothetical protein
LFGENAHYTRAAMNHEVAGPSRATDALEWEVIKEAAASGARWLHTGHSATPGVAAFKERFGARRVVYDEFVTELLPFTRASKAMRTLVKRTVRFDEQARIRHPAAGSATGAGVVVGTDGRVAAAVHEDDRPAEESGVGRQ